MTCALEGESDTTVQRLGGEGSVSSASRSSAGGSLPRPVCLVPGERVADIARGLGFESIVAASALTAKMEQAVCRWYTPERFQA